jgi:hypothetical protein
LYEFVHFENLELFEELHILTEKNRKGRNEQPTAMFTLIELFSAQVKIVLRQLVSPSYRSKSKTPFHSIPERNTKSVF